MQFWRLAQGFSNLTATHLVERSNRLVHQLTVSGGIQLLCDQQFGSSRSSVRSLRPNSGNGFGFGSVLGDLGLPQGALLLALLAFNLWVELGQLVIVAALLPVAYTLRQGGFYRHAVLHAGSLLIAAVAAAWLVERVFDLAFMPF